MHHGTYFIETYGCQMNEHDSEKMAALLEQMGLSAATSPERADVVVINTCSIREKAEHKVYSALGKLKNAKARNPHMIVAVSGCVAQQEKSVLLKKAPHLDLVVGTHHVGDLPALIEQIRTDRSRIESTEFADDVTSLHLHAPNKGRSPVCSYVTVMQGCSNFCTYCVVPYTRGPEQSRAAAEVIKEVRELVDRGVREVTLLGQNVNAYGKDRGDGTSFPGLLEALDRIEGLARVRFTTSHPRDFDSDLVEAMAGLASVCEHIHLPLQSGSDRVLKAMGRRYTREDYLGKVRALRDRCPGVAITADIIVGFPGETEEDFGQTCSALEEIRYDQIFSFKYSPRPGTAAARMTGMVDEEVKARRLAEVHAIQDRITENYHRSAVGAVEEVLIEGRRDGAGQPFGRTRTNKIVNLDASDPAQPGDLVRVRISKGLKHSLLGEREPQA